MLADGLGDGIVLGMDAARQGYLRSYGGAPGLTYLLAEFSVAMVERGIDEGHVGASSSTTRPGIRVRRSQVRLAESLSSWH
jgi:hypothetical protein